jgi:hypothetical protein
VTTEQGAGLFTQDQNLRGCHAGESPHTVLGIRASRSGILGSTR